MNGAYLAIVSSTDIEAADFKHISGCKVWNLKKQNPPFSALIKTGIEYKASQAHVFFFLIQKENKTQTTDVIKKNEKKKAFL